MTCEDTHPTRITWELQRDQIPRDWTPDPNAHKALPLYLRDALQTAG
jgi:hypothetical protein